MKQQLLIAYYRKEEEIRFDCRLGDSSETSVCKFSGKFFVRNFQKNGEYPDI